MLVCTIAAKPPSIIEATEIATITCCHCAKRSPKGADITRRNSASAATLGATEKNAVTGVGAPS